MALPELFLNSPTPGTREQLTTLELELSEVAMEMTWIAAPPAGLHGSGQFRVIIDHEIILCEAGESKVVKIIERGAEESTKIAHAAGTKIYVIVTRGALRAMLEEITVPVIIKPTTNPTFTLAISPIISTSAANVRVINTQPIITGSGAGPAAFQASPKHEPSASITEAFGFISNSTGNPGKEINITKLVGGSAKINTGTGEGAITEAVAFLANEPALSTIKPVTLAGVKVLNQGVAGVGTSVGIDVAEQKSATTSVGVRIAKSTTYALQLSDTGGTATGGITFGTDANLYRSGTSTLKTDTALTVGGDLKLEETIKQKPTISSSSAKASAQSIEPKFTGSGTEPIGVSIVANFEPSVSLALGTGAIGRSIANPAKEITITTAAGAGYIVGTGSGEGAVTNIVTLKANAPVLGTIKPTNSTGLEVINQGAAGITTTVGIDVKEQTGSTTNIGVRIAKGATYALQLSDSGGTTAGGIEFSTDTNLWRSAAKVLKVETILDAETGFRVNGAAASGRYLRGEGTNFISATIKTEDLPAPTAKPAKAAEKAITVGAASPAKKVGATLTGDGAKTEWEIEHKLETRLIHVAVQKAETEEPAESMINGTASGQYTWKATSASKVLIKFVTAPAAGIQIFINVTG